MACAQQMGALVLAAVLLRSVALPAGAPADTAKPQGFRGDFLAQLSDVESKLEQLAEAVPQEKYGWRPGEGVRSVSEVFVHVSRSNYMLPSMIGVKPPEGLPKEMEKTITEKAKVLQTLRESFAYIRDVVLKLPDADLGKPAKFFGRETTVQGVLFSIANHMHEHLGQSIAYARTNGVVPPWSRKQ